MYAFIVRLFLFVLVCSSLSCGGKKVSSEIEDLERPPKIVDFSTPARTNPDQPDTNIPPVAEGEGEEQGNSNVHLSSLSGSTTMLYIFEPFDEAWLMVIKALKKNSAFEITDLDRDRGVFFVTFDPEGHDASVWNNTVSFFTGGSEAEGKYILKLVEEGVNTDVSAEMLLEESLDDEDDDITDPERGVEQLFSTLYQEFQQN